jgi:regulator of protease activity HflC (stomatin/prohibitin superfamily)
MVVNKFIHAERELQASDKLLASANVISQNPQAMQLRYLQTLNDISTDKNTTTIVFSLPISLQDWCRRKAAGKNHNG